MPPKRYSAPRPTAVADSTQSKPRKSMARPSGVSNVVWNAYVQRREAVTTDRQNSLIAKKARDVAATVAEQGEAPRAGMKNAPGHYPHVAWRSHQSVASSTNFSSPLPPS
ncbi:putative methionyl-tRNA synthetase [Hordeum vulgare]|nr:putative methionyl-tRNA synthetase [Hordeum vulgare]